MNLGFKQRLFYFFPVVFCFCLPFGSLVLSGILICWALVSLLNINLHTLKRGLRNQGLQLCYGFFLLTVISAISSSNTAEASKAIEIKLSFFLFPYLFFCFDWPGAVIKRCLAAFVSGCFFASVFLIGRATLFALNGHPEYFFYTRFAYFIHASYFAMYLLLAVAIIVLFYRKWFAEQRSLLYSAYAFALIFVITVFLCSSKTGLIGFFILVPVLILYQRRSVLNVKGLIMIGAIGLFVLILSIKLFPGSFQRFSSLSPGALQHIDKTSSESTTVRVLIWQQALHIIHNNFFLGTGVGDANDQLYEAYQQNGLTGAFEHHFNAHNQFLQTAIGLGLAGSLLLLLLTLGQFIKAFIQRNILLLIFSMLIILNFMVESMLQTAAGVLFFAFFFCLFNITDQKRLSHE